MSCSKCKKNKIRRQQVVINKNFYIFNIVLLITFITVLYLIFK